jgi:hypothetical protein
MVYTVVYLVCHSGTYADPPLMCYRTISGADWEPTLSALPFTSQLGVGADSHCRLHYILTYGM